MKAFTRSVAAALILSFIPSLVYAGCREQESRIQGEIQAWTERAQRQDQGMCRMAREAQRFFSGMRSFYEQCPDYDQDGQMRRYSEQMVDWGEQNEAAVCS